MSHFRDLDQKTVFIRGFHKNTYPAAFGEVRFKYMTIQIMPMNHKIFIQSEIKEHNLDIPLR